MTSPLLLRSDFMDWYDYVLQPVRPGFPGIPWERLSRTAWTRRDDFRHLAEAGLQIPLVGTRETFSVATSVVAYEDERAHRGEGKRLCLARDLRDGEFASTHVGEPYSEHPRSYRALAVGKRTFSWRCVSKTDSWRSNVGEVEIAPLQPFGADYPKVEKALRILQSVRRTPLLAVDFVFDDVARPVAIDLNTAPGLRDTPVQDEIEAVDVERLLRERWVELYPSP